MDFQIDNQTKRDLGLLPEVRNEPSVFACFDLTTTKGGRAALLQLFSSLSNDAVLLTNRMDATRFIRDHTFDLAFDYLDLDFIEHYMAHETPIRRDNFIDALIDKLRNVISPSNDYYIIERGISYLRTHLNKLIEFAASVDKLKSPALIRNIVEEIEEITNQADFHALLKTKPGRFYFINADDRLIRKAKREDVLTILKHTYFLDALSSIGKAALKNNMAFPQYIDSTELRLDIREIFHPFLTNPVSNDIAVGAKSNLCFISGPNMAGKSTFLKSVGICVYLAHVGFPVPARQMETSLLNGLYSSINLSDNINQGYSHYYSEVKRVREIVLAISERNRVCVIFDELFKGTNVKDAYDATLMVMNGFARMKSSMFFTSTHIIEVASELQKQDGIIFKYLNSHLNGDTPVYTYKLLDGVSSERLGLRIVKREGIMEIIDDILKKQEN